MLLNAVNGSEGDAADSACGFAALAVREDGEKGSSYSKAGGCTLGLLEVWGWAPAACNEWWGAHGQLFSIENS